MNAVTSISAHRNQTAALESPRFKVVMEDDKANATIERQTNYS